MKVLDREIARVRAIESEWEQMSKAKPTKAREEAKKEFTARSFKELAELKKQWGDVNSQPATTKELPQRAA